MGHWLAWLLGLTDPSSPPYLALTGVVPASAVLAAAGTWYWRHRCPVENCRRVGRRRVGDSNFVVCRRHHPRWTEAVTPEVLAAIPPRGLGLDVDPGPAVQGDGPVDEEPEATHSAP